MQVEQVDLDQLFGLVDKEMERMECGLSEFNAGFQESKRKIEKMEASVKDFERDVASRMKKYEAAIDGLLEDVASETEKLNKLSEEQDLKKKIAEEVAQHELVLRHSLAEKSVEVEIRKRLIKQVLLQAEQSSGFKFEVTNSGDDRRLLFVSCVSHRNNYTGSENGKRKRTSTKLNHAQSNYSLKIEFDEAESQITRLEAVQTGQHDVDVVSEDVAKQVTFWWNDESNTALRRLVLSEQLRRVLENISDNLKRKGKLL